MLQVRPFRLHRSHGSLESSGRLGRTHLIFSLRHASQATVEGDRRVCCLVTGRLAMITSD